MNNSIRVIALSVTQLILQFQQFFRLYARRCRIVVSLYLISSRNNSMTNNFRIDYGVVLQEYECEFKYKYEIRIRKL